MEHPYQRVLRKMRVFIIDHMTEEIMEHMKTFIQNIFSKNTVEDVHIMNSLRGKIRLVLNGLRHRPPTDILNAFARMPPNIISNRFLLLCDEATYEHSTKL